jgi:hypothetical protein
VVGIPTPYHGVGRVAITLRVIFRMAAPEEGGGGVSSRLCRLGKTSVPSVQSVAKVWSF